MIEDLKTLTSQLIEWLQEEKPQIYLESVAPLPPTLPKKAPKKVIPTAPTQLRKKPQKAPTPVPPVKPTPKPVSAPLKLQPLQSKEEDPLTDIASLFQKTSPNLFLHSRVPDDRKARLHKSAWRIKSKLIDVPIFITRELRRFAPFLHNLAKAIDVSFAPSRVIEIDQLEAKNLWSTLLDEAMIKLIICPDIALWASPHLVTHYKQLPGEAIHKLDNLDFLVLPELSLYMKDPSLKRSLWNTLRNTLSSSAHLPLIDQ